MRLALVCLFALAACRTPPLDHPITDDFGTRPRGDMGTRDMTMPKFDMAQPNGSSCSALLQCLSNCQDQSCQNDCFNNASPDAQQLLSSTLNCIYGFCLLSDGNRPPRCVQGPDGNFDDPSDGGVGECNQCLQNAFASLGGYPCSPPNDPDCNPAQCQSMVLQCQQN